MEKETKMLLWTLFGISAVAIAIVPTGWLQSKSALEQTSKSNGNMEQVLWNQNSAPQYNFPDTNSVSIIPGALTPTIQSVTWDTSTWGPGIKIEGYGFGNTSAKSGFITITDETRNWTESQLVISSWVNKEIDISGLGNYGGSDPNSYSDGQGNFIFAPGDSLSISITNPQTGNKGSNKVVYPQDALMPTLTVNPLGSKVVAGTKQTVSGRLMLNGKPLSNQTVNASVTSGTLSGGVYSDKPTTYYVRTDNNGNFSFTYTAPRTSVKGVQLSVWSDGKSFAETFDVAPPFTILLQATGDQTDNNVTLTATTNYPVDGFTLSILDKTQGKVIASTNHGTTLTTTITAVANQTHSYVAEVN